MITIGTQQFKTATPKNLDEQLVASTGCGVREIETILSAGTDRVARALRPFLDPEAMPDSELARAVADDPNAVTEIRKLYASVSVPPAAKPEEVA